MEMVAGGGEVFNRFEFRHKGEGSVELKDTPVVPAPQLAAFTGFPGQKVTAVGTYIGKAVQGIAFVARKEQWFVQVAGKQRDGVEATGIRYQSSMPDILPARTEYAFPVGFEELVFLIISRFKGFGAGDVCFDFQRFHTGWIK